MVIDLLGISLTEWVKREGKLSLEMVVKIGIQGLEMLQGIHNRGMIHRDIKPDNFLLDLQKGMDQLYLIDFGLCKSFPKEEVRVTHSMIGTPNFASIPSHQYNELGPMDDLESFGYTLLFLYLGTLPWMHHSNLSRDEIKQLKMDLLTKNQHRIPEVLFCFLRLVQKREIKGEKVYPTVKHIFLDFLEKKSYP
jgi:serine/threonine protein kinase